MIGNAEAMFGPGYVWLVAQKESTTSETNAFTRQLAGKKDKSQPSTDLALMNTYIAGSPYASAHYRKQDKDVSTQDFGVLAGQTPAAYALDRRERAAALKSNAPIFAPNAADIEPLLCVSTWEHAWVPQYGIRGKKEYLERWWSKVDWHTVSKNWHETTIPLKERPKNSYGSSFQYNWNS